MLMRVLQCKVLFTHDRPEQLFWVTVIFVAFVFFVFMLVLLCFCVATVYQ